VAKAIPIRVVTIAVPRIALVVAFLALVSCSGKSTKDGKDGQTDEGVKTPAEAAKLVGKRVTVEMVVRSLSVSSSSGAYLLHDTKYAIDDDAFTIVISERVAKQFKGLTFENRSADFQGAKVRATGEVRLVGGKPEIEVDDPKLITMTPR
jgi:hypothetical protein